MRPPDPHGGNVHAASRELDLPVRRLLDFSASINPLGPSPRALKALLRAVPELGHYPDPDCVVLRRALARRLRIPAEHFVIGNGSTELIHVLPRLLFPPGSVARDAPPVLIMGPTFSEYARAIGRHGASVLEVPADRKSDYEPPIDDAIRELRRMPLAVIVLCNPNSPTGRAVPARAVRDLLAVASSRHAWLIVDETFAEYAVGTSILRDVVRHPGLLVLRSFTKFYALPGLRVGYAVASQDVAARLRSLLPPWSVNTLAQAAATAALSDVEHARRSLRFMRHERARLARELQALPGVKVYPTQANFLLLEVPVPARALTSGLRRHGVLVRNCSTVAGLTEQSIRVAIRTRAENDRLVALLRSLLASGERQHVHADVPLHHR